MDVLLIGSDNPLGEAVLATGARWGRHQFSSLGMAASRWRSERQAKKASRKAKPEAILDLRLAWQVASEQVPHTLDVERTHWLAKACEHSGIQYLFLSSDQVFAGHTGRNLRETDKQDACSEPGFQLVEAENRVVQAAPSAAILRTGPLFAPTDRNLLTTVLRQFASASDSTLDDRDVFCPVASDDAARVILAMLDQLSVGAQAEGVYHYCSGDRTTAFGFAEAVLAAASQYSDYGDVVLRAHSDEDAASETRVLDCSRLRDAFAIKQMPWRRSIDALVRQYHIEFAATTE